MYELRWIALNKYLRQGDQLTLSKPGMGTVTIKVMSRELRKGVTPRYLVSVESIRVEGKVAA